jgi:GntR family transcriptional regulator of arabinose operon
MEQQASQACRQLIAKRVSGIFFAPLELTPQKDAINRGIAEALDKAGIPVVLLDRDLVSYPERSRYDLVGIDNRRAGYVVTQHLVRCGCRNVIFLGRPGSAPTVDARIVGYREAVADAKLKRGPQVCRVDPEDQAQVKKISEGAPSRWFRLRQRFHGRASSKNSDRLGRLCSGRGRNGRD